MKPSYLHREVQSIIQAIRSSDPFIETIYLNGGCYRFYLILKEIYPEAKLYINEDENHVSAYIRGAIYDITGLCNEHMVPATQEQEKKCQAWGFSNKYQLATECPYCQEAIPIQEESTHATL